MARPRKPKTPPPVDPTRPAPGPKASPTASGITDMVTQDGRKVQVAKISPEPSMSAFDSVGDADDFEEQPEVTPITDLPGLFTKMAKTSKLVEIVAETVQEQSVAVGQIPQVAQEAKKAWKAANETREEVIIVRTRQEDMSGRLERIESNGHPCHMRPRVEHLEQKQKTQDEEQEKDAETRVKVEQVEKSVKEVKDERKSLSKTVIGIIVSVVLAGLGSGGSAIWYLRGVDARIELESQARELRDKNLDDRLKALPTKKQLNEQLPTKTDVQKLTTAVKNGDDHEKQTQLLRELWTGYNRSQKIRWCRTKRSRLPEDLRRSCPR